MCLAEGKPMTTPPFPGTRITTNGNQLVSYHTEARITQGGVFYPITPSTEMGENYQMAFAEGLLDVYGNAKFAVETEGEHSAQGGAIALSMTGKRVVNFTSGQGLVYGLEQYYHAPGKLSTLVVEVAARALTKHALNVHCGHDDIYAALDTGWMMLFAKDAQQAADQALIARRVAELSLNPAINIQDGFLTSHLERTFFRHESEMIRQFLGAHDDIIESPTPAQRELFGPTRARVPRMIDLKNPMLLGPVQNQEHYMNGVIARRSNFADHVGGFLEEAYEEFARLTGRRYGMISEYRCDDAETVFVSLGSAAENIEAAVDFLRENDDAKVGSIHVNVLRPFPEAALIEGLRGKKRAIVLERTDDPLSGDNPLASEIRASINKGVEVGREDGRGDVPVLTPEEIPLQFAGTYGLGSRDFRPEHVLGAYEFAIGQNSRQDGSGPDDGVRNFVLGIDHPHAVISERAPSLLPDGAIAVRFHSIGGWGMITTGKNLSEIIGEIGEDLARRNEDFDELGRPREIVHVSANPRYGSEKKGAPTQYFLVAAPERIKVNCDLRHVDVVLCCDPKAFTHTNPLDGLNPGGTFIIESDEEPDRVWSRFPIDVRRQIVEDDIKVFALPGFDIARAATDRDDLQLRMQGNAFLGAFFAVSGLLDEYGMSMDQFHELVRSQYVKKFGRFGDAVVESNMEVMTEGLSRIREIPHGPIDAPDRSTMRRQALEACSSCGPLPSDRVLVEQPVRMPLARTATFDAEFRAGLGYDQPSSALASVGMMPAATGATASKYGSRRQTPVWVAEKCTQCLECITACPDTALPNTAQDISTILKTVANAYIADVDDRRAVLAAIPEIESTVRAQMHTAIADKDVKPFVELLTSAVVDTPTIDDRAREQFLTLFERVPFAYFKTPAVFRTLERKNPGSGGLFSIMVSDLCKGCGECVVECGEREALYMADETAALNADHVSGTNFLKMLDDTPAKFLGRFDPKHPEDSHVAQLKNHLMLRSQYEALVSGDGACAGCGEKTALHAVASLTESYMRPIFHAKADRLSAKVERLMNEGEQRLALLAETNPSVHELFKRSVARMLMGLGGNNPEDTDSRIAAHGKITDAEVVDAIAEVMRRDAFNHRDLQAVDGRTANGMSVMAMGANTGCNTVYGSTPVNNPHPYPWMNSLFQDGATVSWLLGEGFMLTHARRSVTPERLCDHLLAGEAGEMTVENYHTIIHLTDTQMTPREIREMPKVWAIGGDGGMGDIGFQNVSKVVLQNRPNVNLLMLDTQVYSNTGGQNSDSTPMPGGGDMNQFGPLSQGKLTEKKGVAETFLGGHGSPFIGQVSAANTAQFYKAILTGLEYRGTSFFQCFTTCQPEHGVPDDMSTQQATCVRDSRGMPQFVFAPAKGESYEDALDLAGNPSPNRDWYQKTSKASGRHYQYMPPHWAVTEARFRNHWKPAESAEGLIELYDMLTLVTQNDVVQRQVFDPEHRSFIPDWGVFTEIEDSSGNVRTIVLSRQMVLFCVERRRSWRMLQSRAGVVNVDYAAQKAVLVAMKADDDPDRDRVAFAAKIRDSELEVLLEA
ncbi:MAG: oxidoreductase [Actinomycetia bacterium]|nr:oxidoreductase [Actinomycetes bacterium]